MRLSGLRDDNRSYGHRSMRPRTLSQNDLDWADPEVCGIGGGIMRATILFCRRRWVMGSACTLAGVTLILVALSAPDSRASWPWGQCSSSCQPGCGAHFVGDGIPPGELGGAWYWLRSPEEEK